MKYSIKSVAGKGDFDIGTPAEARLCRVVYKGVFSSEAQAQIGKNHYEIKSRNMWWTHFDRYKNGVDVGDLLFNWKGQIVIKMEAGSASGKRFLLKGKGLFTFHFVLENEKGDTLMTMHPNFNWKRFQYNYEVSTQDVFMGESPEEFLELLIACGYGANLYRMMGAGGAM